MRRTLVARGAAASLLTGVVVVTLAVVAGPTSPITGYVSEAGVGTSGYATAYQVGIFAVAVGLLLLAAALPPTLRTAAFLLAVGAAGTGLSASVPCTAGCPLPPFEPTTTTDLVHGSGSILAVACVVFAMLAIAWSGTGVRVLRRLGLVGATMALPLSVTIGLAMLTVGRGPLIGAVERTLLLVIALWAIASALTAGFAQGDMSSTGPAGSAVRHPGRR
ncbi:DUF998 domain-containing protein [Micromonospora sp. NPDC049523]|uniref:DUF998 domain-containing protein n=1 Tax=Micromonospora sp. NPDC049523 TaxID=3155921 RepID=UPI003441F41B